MKRRVVVTGVGMVTPLGSSAARTWDGLKAGRSGIAPITLFEASEFPTKIAGEVKNFSIADFGEDEATWRSAGRNIKFAIAAAKEAVADSGFRDVRNYNPLRTGVYTGAGEGGQDFLTFVSLIARSWDDAKKHSEEEKFAEIGVQNLDGDKEMEQEPGMSASHIAALFDAQGPNFNCLTACAASSQAIGEAVEIIRRNDADVMISGGAHSMINPFGVTGFNRLTALSTRNGEPTKASRPFDRHRDGFVIGEGAGMVVLEELEFAKRRGAHIYGEITGYGSTADAFRVTDTHPQGRGAIACMRQALHDAQLSPKEIQYINAHGTSTDINDRVESLAIKEVFGELAYKVPVSSIKSMSGHLIAAAGSVEAITCLLAIRDGIAPPTINYETPDPDCDLDYIPNKAREVPMTNTVSNSFGFGGQNVALVISRFVG